MKFLKVKQAAEVMRPDEVQANLRSLVQDVRFPAVVRLLLDQEEWEKQAGTLITMASDHGRLAYAAGYRASAIGLLNQLKEVCEPPKRRGVQAPRREE